MNSTAASRSQSVQAANQYNNRPMNGCGCGFDRACALTESAPTALDIVNIPARVPIRNQSRVSLQRNERDIASVPQNDGTFSRMYERSSLGKTNANDSFHVTEAETISRIEKRYGDLRHLHLAANVIQKAYRSHVLNKSFLDLRNRQQRAITNDEQPQVDADGTMTLTPHRMTEWQNDGTLRPNDRGNDGKHNCNLESPNNNASTDPRCADCSRSAKIREGSASRLAQPAQIAEEPNGRDRSPVWIRKTPTFAEHQRPPLHPNARQHKVSVSDVNVDADSDAEVEEDIVVNRVVLRTAKWIEEAHPTRAHEHQVPARMTESVRTERERPLSYGAPSASSRDCPCEECRMAQRVAQLGIVFGCEARQVSPMQCTNALAVAAKELAMRRPDTDRTRKRLYRVALNLFNRQPEAGVQFLVAAGFVRDEPRAVARFLLVRRGLSRSAIGEFLGGALRNAAIDQVLAAVAGAYRFTDRPIDLALRRFQAAFQLTGEAQRIQHIVEVFAHAYATQNEAQLAATWRTQKRADLVQLIALACVMLNTDLHSPSVRADRKMKPEEFVRNLSGLDDGADLDRNALLSMYERVRAEPLATAPDHVTHVRKLETLVIGLTNARPLNEQRRKSSAASLLSRQAKSNDTPPTPVYRFETSKLAISFRRLVCYCRLFEVSESQVRKLVAAGTVRLGEHSRARSSSLQSVRPDADDDDLVQVRSSGARCDQGVSVSLSESQKREVFLFNDSLLVSKLNAKSKAKKERTVSYAFRQLVSLVNARVSLFECAQAPFGVCVITPSSDVHCVKNASDLFVVSEQDRNAAKPRTVWYDGGSTASSTNNNSTQDMVVLAFTAKSASDRQKFCDDLVESIVETRTLRRVLGRMADGVSPVEVARSYVEQPFPPPKLNDLATAAHLHAQRSVDDASLLGMARRGSEPVFNMMQPMRNVPSNSSLSNASSAYGSHGPGSVSHHSTTSSNNGRPLSAALPPNDAAVLRHTPILSVSSASSSSLVSVGTLSTASNDGSCGWQPHADAASSQSGASRRSNDAVVVRHTPANGSASITPDKELAQQQPRALVIPTTAIIRGHTRSPSASAAASASVNQSNALMEASARRNLQFASRVGLTQSHANGSHRPNDDITFVAENRDYLTLADAPVNRAVK